MALLPVSFIALPALPSDDEIAVRLASDNFGDEAGWVDIDSDATVVTELAVRGKTFADAEAALKRRGISPDTSVNAEIFERLKADANSLRISLTANVIGIALLAWGSISAAIYVLGWAIGWVVSRLLKNSPNRTRLV
ncbi:MAG: hypothetical protein ACREV9_17850 [Burkholderiales bacterium]